MDRVTTSPLLNLRRLTRRILLPSSTTRPHPPYKDSLFLSRFLGLEKIVVLKVRDNVIFGGGQGVWESFQTVFMQENTQNNNNNHKLF